MRHFHVLVRWLVALFRDLPGVAGVGIDAYSKEWQDRGYPGDGI